MTDEQGRPERRAIDNHVLSYVDKRIGEYTERVEGFLEKCADKSAKEFGAHTVEEMKRYKSIEDKIDIHTAASEKRNEHIADAIEALHSDFQMAFALDKRGKPDLLGHSRAHEEWIDESKSTRELKEYIKRVVLAAACLALASWVGALIWQGVIHGPAR